MITISALNMHVGGFAMCKVTAGNLSTSTVLRSRRGAVGQEEVVQQLFSISNKKSSMFNVSSPLLGGLLGFM